MSKLPNPGSGTEGLLSEKVYLYAVYSEPGPAHRLATECRALGLTVQKSIDMSGHYTVSVFCTRRGVLSILPERMCSSVFVKESYYLSEVDMWFAREACGTDRAWKGCSDLFHGAVKAEFTALREWDCDDQIDAGSGAGN